MSAPLRPMLATRATPFDSEEYSFEVKWDGVRALAAVENGRWQLSGRAGSDYTHRYPELAMLRHLPSGTVIDGELVALRGRCANFSALLQRHQRNSDDLHLPGPSIYYNRRVDKRLITSAICSASGVCSTKCVRAAGLSPGRT